MEELNKGYEFTKAQIAELESLRAWKAEIEKQEPVAWMRKWAFDGETPAKERNSNGRMAWPSKFKILPVTLGKFFKDDVRLYTIPVVSPDVEKLIKERELPKPVEENLCGLYNIALNEIIELKDHNKLIMDMYVSYSDENQSLKAELEAARNGFVEWDAEHIKTGNIYRVVGEALDATNMSRGMHMVIYRREGKTFVREASEFQAKFRAAIKQAKGV